MASYNEVIPALPENPEKLRQEVKRQQAQIIALQRDLGQMAQAKYWAELKVQVLEARLREERIKRLGPRSEKLSDLQLALLEEEPSATLDEVAAEAGRDPLPETPAPQNEAAAKKPEKKRQAHPGRQTLPAHLPRKAETIVCPPAGCQCKSCGGDMTVIGHDESEVLEVEPAVYYVKVIKREKRACRACADRSVVAAPLPARIIEKGLASDRVVVNTVVDKYGDHLPLYRQAAILSREAGLEISRVTLDGWVMQVGESLLPVWGAMRKELLAEPYLQADETTVQVQTRDKRGEHHQAYLWQYGRPGGSVVFDFRRGRGREGPAQFLGSWAGILQTDGYQAYDDGVGGPGLTHVGCWSHCRRGYVDAVKVNKHDEQAVSMVEWMDGLFLIDRYAREHGLTAVERLALRKEEGQEFIELIRKNAREWAPRTLPKSSLGKALTYTNSQWEKLQRAFDLPETELSNNIAENSMRPWALGRKNWLHVGSFAAGPKIAAIASVVESCRRLGLPVKQYMLEILPGLQYRTLSQVGELTPARWAAARS